MHLYIVPVHLTNCASLKTVLFVNRDLLCFFLYSSSNMREARSAMSSAWYIRHSVHEGTRFRARDDVPIHNQLRRHLCQLRWWSTLTFEFEIYFCLSIELSLTTRIQCPQPIPEQRWTFGCWGRARRYSGWSRRRILQSASLSPIGKLGSRSTWRIQYFCWIHSSSHLSDCTKPSARYDHLTSSFVAIHDEFSRGQFRDGAYICVEGDCVG